jgi:hypothetical protein
VAAFPDASLIYERNVQVLEALGREGWEALGLKINTGVIHNR